jgi:hypothetical protein
MRPLSVLLTNNALNQRAGSETYIRDVAFALIRRGHRPVAFSVVLGEIAAELRAGTVPTIDDLALLGEPPDVIHGHHHVETLIAALTFPNTPIVNFCHGWIPWEEMPLHHPAVRRYVAVDDVCRDRLVRVEGIAPEKVDLLLNFVDVDRFRPRQPLPRRPARALVLSNGATLHNYTRAIAKACEDAGITLDVIGREVGNASTAPEALLAGYDLVFAKARTALESLAVGCATVITDVIGAGPLVTPENYPALRARNFGVRELQHAHDPAWYAEQIARYDPTAAAVVSARVRVEAALEPAIDRLLEIYASAIASPPGSGDPLRAAAAHCTRIAAEMKEAPVLRVRVSRAAQDLAVVQAELEASRAQVATAMQALAGTTENLAAAQADNEALRVRVTAAAADLDVAKGEARLLRSRVQDLNDRVALVGADVANRDEQVRTALRDVAEARAAAARTSGEVETLRREVAAFKALPTLKLRDAVLQAPVIGPLVRSAVRGLAALLRGSDR